MGRKSLILTFFVFCLALAACEKSVSETKSPNVSKSSPTPVTAPSFPKDGNYDGTGEVTKINMELGSVELKHDDMPGLMPAMQMEFYVKDKTMLKDLKIGDRVRFVLEYKHPQETITSIKKAE